MVFLYNNNTEFVGKEYEGFAALADMPSKVVILFLLPSMLKLFGAREGKALLTASSSSSTTSTSTTSSSTTSKNPIKSFISTIVYDPFNLAITIGLTLALLKTPASSLGFFGKAMKSLASAQTPILFLLIGLKLKFNGAAIPLCGSLLFARHGFIALITSLFLKLFLPPLSSSSGGLVTNTLDMIEIRQKLRLLTTLCSQAACSVIAYAQINKIEKLEPKLGYKPDLSFDLVALSFPLTIVINTFTILAGYKYVDNLPFVGISYLFISSLFYFMQKKKIDSL